MMIMVKPFVVPKIVVVVARLSIVVLVGHPLRHLHAPPCVHDNHTSHPLCIMF
jgi:hypothetical protein